MPGQLGNSAIAGHRTTYGQPFFRLDEVAVGDEIVLTTVQGRFVYRMTGSEVVGPDRSDVVATTDPTVARLTLTTCHPRYTAAQRLILYADLDTAASSPTQPAVIAPDAEPTATLPGGPVTSTAAAPTTAPATDPATTTPAATTPATTAAPTTTATATTVGAPSSDEDGPSEVGDATADAFSHGWFSDDGAPAPGRAVGTGAGRHRHRVVAAQPAGPAQLGGRARRHRARSSLVLYFFFQNVNRLLPAAL